MGFDGLGGGSSSNANPIIASQKGHKRIITITIRKNHSFSVCRKLRPASIFGKITTKKKPSQNAPQPLDFFLLIAQKLHKIYNLFFNFCKH